MSVLLVLMIVALLGIAGFANGVAILGVTLTAISVSVLVAVFVSELRAGAPPMP